MEHEIFNSDSSLVLIFIGVIAIYALIWAFYAMIHFRAPRQGLPLLGYGSIAVSAVATVVFLVYGVFG